MSSIFVLGLKKYNKRYADDKRSMPFLFNKYTPEQFSREDSISVKNYNLLFIEIKNVNHFINEILNDL